MSLDDLARLAAFFAAGLALGAASFLLLRKNASLYVEGAVWRSAAIHFGRLGAMAALLVLAALQGAGPLLACAFGVVLARIVVVRRLGRAA